MKRVMVKFDNYDKEYTYVTNLNLIEGRKYMIRSNDKVYQTPVIILSVRNARDADIWRYKEIIQISEVAGPARRKSPVVNVMFNKKKGYTTVIWVDGSKTILKCDSREAYFDKEKAIGLAFMKRSFNNSSCFNDELKKWCGENYDACEDSEVME